MSFVKRRHFLKAGALGFTGAIAIPSLAGTVQTKAPKNAPEKLTILFQGDSITDAGRDKARYYANVTPGMGTGYVFQIVTQLLGANPDKDWKYYNRGISGNKVYQLAERWEDDCLQLKPDVLSILIGVNDFWHTLNKYKGTVEVFEADLRNLLDRTKNQYPNLKIILGEPFAVKGGTAINDRWFPEFPKYQVAVRKIADDYKTAFIPYQKVFNEALQLAPAKYWCPDGVHPSMAGGYLMKEAWIKHFMEQYL
jgi:lysophospholipase L1-like esterase